MRAVAVLVAFLAGTVFSGAQTKNPVSEVTRDVVAARQKTIVAAVEAMPADKFGYKPTADQMTFGTWPSTLWKPTISFVPKRPISQSPRSK